jgi:hypothetical protein
MIRLKVEVTFVRRYLKAGGHCVEVSMKYIRVNIIWKIINIRWTLILHFE